MVEEGTPRGGLLAGKEWQPRDIASMCYEAGWQQSLELVTAVAVCLSESQGFQKAVNDNKVGITDFQVNETGLNVETYEHYTVLDPARGRVRNSSGQEETFPVTVQLIRSRDCGLFQINIPAESVGTEIEESLFEDPEFNVQHAFGLYSRRGFQPWYGYTKNVYLRDTYLKRASRGVGNFMANELLLRTPTDTLNQGQPYVHSLTTPILDYQYRTALLSGGLSRVITLAKAIKPLATQMVDVKLDELIKVATTARNEAKK